MLPAFLLPLLGRIALGAAITTGAALLGYKAHNIGEDKMFNNGVCSKCGGNFEFKTETMGCRAYKCDFCNNSILLSKSSLVDENYKYRPSEISKK